MKKSREILNAVLPDSRPNHDLRHEEFELLSHGIAIRPTGYGKKLSQGGHGAPIYFGFRNAIPYLIIWDDINREDPSHFISFKKAAEWLRTAPSCP